GVLPAGRDGGIHGADLQRRLAAADGPGAPAGAGEGRVRAESAGAPRGRRVGLALPVTAVPPRPAPPGRRRLQPPVRGISSHFSCTGSWPACPWLRLPFRHGDVSSRPG